jgi:hypothetical protein
MVVMHYYLIYHNVPLNREDHAGYFENYIFKTKNYKPFKTLTFIMHMRTTGPLLISAYTKNNYWSNVIFQTIQKCLHFMFNINNITSVSIMIQNTSKHVHSHCSHLI